MLSVHSSPLGELGTRDTGGMSVYIRELAMALGRQGHLVDMYTRQNNRPAASARLLPRMSPSSASRPAPAGTLTSLPCTPISPNFLRRWSSSGGGKTGTMTSFTAITGFRDASGHWAQLHWHVPHFVLFHTLGAVKNLFPIGSPEPQLRIATEKFVSRQCSLIVAETERERLQLLQLYGVPLDKISIIPCGVNFDRFRPLDKEAARQKLGISGSETILLFVGRLDPLKGVDRLITALARLKHHKRLRLLIVGGDGRETEEFCNAAGTVTDPGP